MYVKMILFERVLNGKMELGFVYFFSLGKCDLGHKDWGLRNHFCCWE